VYKGQATKTLQLLGHVYPGLVRNARETTYSWIDCI